MWVGADDCTHVGNELQFLDYDNNVCPYDEACPSSQVGFRRNSQFRYEWFVTYVCFRYNYREVPLLCFAQLGFNWSRREDDIMVQASVPHSASSLFIKYVSVITKQFGYQKDTRHDKVPP
jgi:hypothetical protein